MKRLRHHKLIAAFTLAGLLSLSLVSSFHAHEHEHAAESSAEHCDVCIATSQLHADSISVSASAFTGPTQSFLLPLGQSQVTLSNTSNTFNSRAPPAV